MEAALNGEEQQNGDSEYVQVIEEQQQQEDENAGTSIADDTAVQEEKGIKRVALGLRLSGMVGMTFLNPFCGVLAMNYASPSILAPFSGLTLVWIVLFSNILIDEQPSQMQIFAAGLIVFGEVIVAVFGDHTNDVGITLAQLEESYTEPSFICYMVGITLWLLLLGYWMKKRSTSPFLKRFAYGVAGGSITGIQNFVKDGLTVLKAGEGLPWYFPIFIMGGVGTAFAGLLLLTACMKRYDATYSSSMFVGAYVVSASLMSALHYGTFGNLKNLINYFLYPLGLLILMAGVWILVKETKEDIDENLTNSTSNVSEQEMTGLVS